MTALQYRLTGRLEAGELAELYEAEVTSAQGAREKVVVKLFHPRTSDERYARLIAEIAGKLEGVGPDEAIVRPQDAGMVDGRLALVREWVDGHTLGAALQRLATRDVLITPPLALYLVIQLLDAVGRAHAQGAVHGAITPGNVLLGREGRVALADFGALAALQAVPQLRPFTQKGRGTYRAPESAHGDAPSPLTDVYSLGAIAYELLTLREPVRGGGGKAMSTRAELLPAPSRIDRRINGRLDPIILRALEQHPSRRFRSCADLSMALRNFLSASGGMPSRADLARLLGELFPQPPSAPSGKDLPLTEPFTLEPVAGAQLGAVAPAPSVLMPRPSFSGGGLPAVLLEDLPPGAETVEAMPAFSPWEPEKTVVPDRPEPAPRWDEGTARGAASVIPEKEPEPERTSAPSPAASSAAQGWDAPPGAAPVRRKPLAQAPPAPGSQKGRVRVIEDFSDQTVDDPTDPTAAQKPAGKPPRARAPTPPPSQQQPQQLSEPGVLSGPSDVPLVKEPGGRKRRMFTEEVNLFRAAQKRKHFLAIAAAVALVGVFCFVLVVWRFAGAGAGSASSSAVPPGRSPPPPSATSASQVAGAKAEAAPGTEAPARPARAPGAPSLGTPVRIEAEPEATTGHAFLTITSNVRARVYVNGKALRGYTPLRRKRLEPGTHKIAVVAVRTGERREFTQRFEAGKTVTLTERFKERRR